MALKLIYQMFAKLLSWMVLHVRSDTAKEIEILVLRHQLAVLQLLQRRTPQLRISWSDRAVIAALGRILPLVAAADYWSPRPRSCAGIGNSSAVAGPHGLSGQAAPPSPPVSAP